MTKFQAGDSGTVRSEDDVFEVVIVDTTEIDPDTGLPIITAWSPCLGGDLNFEADPVDGRHYQHDNCAYWLE